MFHKHAILQVTICFCFTFKVLKVQVIKIKGKKDYLQPGNWGISSVKDTESHIQLKFQEWFPCCVWLNFSDDVVIAMVIASREMMGKDVIWKSSKWRGKVYLKKISLLRMLNWYFLEVLKEKLAWESVAISDFSNFFCLKRTYDFALKQKIC